MPRNAFRQKGIEEVNCDCEKFNLFFLSFLKKHLLTISVLNFDLVKNEASKIMFKKDESFFLVSKVKFEANKISRFKMHLE